MASNDAFTRNDDGDLAVRTVSSTGDNYVDPNDVYTRDDDGNLAVRVTGAGGDSHNLGWYETPTALNTAHPTAEAGDWAIVGSTDTVWVWDTDSTAWVDTDSKAEVTPDMIIVKSATMPTASTTPAGAVYQYVGATDSTYTHGYIYENKQTTTYDSTVSFEAATLSSSTIACSGSDFATFVAEWGSGDITTITHGTLTYDQSGGLLVFVGKDAEDTTVCTFQLYTEDYQDAGFTITGTLQDGDVFAFTTTITESFSYAWTRIDVQPAPVIPDPLPSQTGNAGKFLTTDGADASWSDRLKISNNRVLICGSESYGWGADSICVGRYSNSGGDYGVAVGCNASAAATSATGLGYDAISLAASAIMIGSGINSETQTLKIGLADDRSKQYKLLDSDGTIPADRTSPVTTISTATVVQALTSQYIYECGEMTSIEITLPATINSNFIAELHFTSGTTPTSFTSPVGMKWLGDDCNGTAFVPVASKRYMIMIASDGVSVRGIVQAA